MTASDDSIETVRGAVSALSASAPTAVATEELDGSVWTFAELAARVRDIRSTLPPGARRIAIGVSNDNESVARICAVWESGASAVLISALLPDAEAARRVTESYCDAVLGRPGVRAGLAAGTAPAAADEALVVFTSGTTGRPKAAVLTVGALQRSLASMAIGSGIAAAGRLPATPPRTANPIFTPMAHMSGVLAVIAGWHIGKPLLLVPKFDAAVALRLIDEFGVTSLKLTPAMVYDLVRWPERRGLGAVKSVVVGTASIPEVIHQEFEQRYGVPLLRNYGQTEFSGAIAFERYDDAVAGRRPKGTIGQVAPGVEVRIVGPDGADVAAGATGEIVARGGGSMTGYLGSDGRPVAPGPNMWVHTGDLGSIDKNGFLSVLGRADDTILCGGFNIYPATVEAALNTLPGIRDSAVAGAPHDRLGEIPVAVVVADNNHSHFEETRKALKAELAPYEIPRKIVRVDALPRTDNGKIDRRAVLRTIETTDPTRH